MPRLVLLIRGTLLAAVLTATAQTAPAQTGTTQTPPQAGTSQKPAPAAPGTVPTPVPGSLTPPTAARPRPDVVATSPDARVFASDVGLVINPIKPAKTADFEAVIQKLREALRLSVDPVRRQQAQGWKVYKAAETGADGTVYYVFVVDPVVKNADYTITTVLRDAYPKEIDALLEKFIGAYAGGQSLLNLKLVTNLKPQ